MPCCNYIDMIKDIVKGNTALLIEQVFKLPVAKCKFTEERIETCKQCTKGVWHTKAEFALYVISNLGEFIKNLNNLSKLPEMPLGSYGKHKHLFCRICKCYIPAKARLVVSKCDLGKWKN